MLATGIHRAIARRSLAPLDVRCVPAAVLAG